MIPPYFQGEGVTLYTGDAVEVLKSLPADSVDCAVTSPPYWRLRDYGTGHWTGGDPSCAHALGRNTDLPPRCRYCRAVREDRQLGLESTPRRYVDALREVFVELRRVLVATGTVWLNLGDSYGASAVRAEGAESSPAAQAVVRKSLVGMPWRVALALQADGWILRNAIVWHKPNAIPESVRDRMSTRYELLLLLVKQPRYFFDLDPVRERLVRPEAIGERRASGGANKGRHAGIGATARRRGTSVYGRAKYADTAAFTDRPPGAAIRPTGRQHNAAHPNGRNPGDVWSLPTRPLRAAHFAAFPVDIPLRCIAAGCPPDGFVLDPFSGASTTGLAARQLDRRYIGVDLNPAFHNIALDRLGLCRPATADGDGSGVPE